VANTVLYEKQDGVGTVTLNQPETLNALGTDLLRDLLHVLTLTIEDRSVRAIILTGAGKGFCSGANLSPRQDSTLRQNISALIRTGLNPVIAMMRTSDKPIIVAVNGAAAGAGVGLALSGDIVIAARSAKFILSFVRLGASLDAGTSLLVQQAVGLGRAKAMALLAESISAPFAESWGLVWKCVNDEDLMTNAAAIARTVAKGPPLALAAIKAQLEQARLQGLSDVLEEEACRQIKSFSTQDLSEGLSAFRERREPRFNGS